MTAPISMDNRILTLESILENHPNHIWKDDLSHSLHKWGQKTLEVLRVDPCALSIRLEKLFNRVMVNPLDGMTPLETPCLERDWVWEERYVQEYLSLDTNSPFDHEQMGEIKPHTFAEKVMCWARESSVFLAEQGGELSLQPEPSLLELVLLDEEQDSIMKYFRFHIAANQTLNSQLQRIVYKQAKQFKQTVQEVALRAKTRAAESQARQHEALSALEESIQGGCKSLEDNQQEVTQSIHEQTESYVEQAEELKEELEYQSAKKTELEQKVQILKNQNSETLQKIKKLKKHR